MNPVMSFYKYLCWHKFKYLLVSLPFPPHYEQAVLQHDGGKQDSTFYLADNSIRLILFQSIHFFHVEKT